MVFKRQRPLPIRPLGLLSLVFFLAQAVHYWETNELSHVLWMCNIGNLVLALGLVFEKWWLVRIAVIWAFPGLIVWLVYVVPTWGMLLTGQYTFSQLFGIISSSLAHLGGLSLGLVVLRRIGMDRRTWVYAFLWYLIMQILSRLLTPPALNVNLAHRVQDGFESSFSSYWKFWLLLTFLVGAGGWLLGQLLQRIWPMPGSDEHSSVSPQPALAVPEPNRLPE